MMKPLLAFFSLVALPAAALSQPAVPGQWNVSASSSGCIAYSSFPQGTVVSVLAGRGQQELIFMIQNRNWSSLQDGGRYPLALNLDGQSHWQFDAVARTELDSDGPGLLFTVEPGDQNHAKFLAAFAGATGMDVGQNGRALARLRLGGGASAMSQLARCMASMWNGGAGEELDPVASSSPTAAIPL